MVANNDEIEISQIYEKLEALKSMANDVERDVNRFKRELKKIDKQTTKVVSNKEDVRLKLVEKIERSQVSSEEDLSETETEKELMDDFFKRVSLRDHSPLELDKICLHADNVKVMSPTKITKWKMRQSLRRLRSSIVPNNRDEIEAHDNSMESKQSVKNNSDRLTTSSSGSSLGEEIPMINKKHYKEENIEIGCCSVSRKKIKKMKKKSDYKFSIVSMKHQENQIPNIFSWTKSYVPNNTGPSLALDYQTI